MSPPSSASPLCSLSAAATSLPSVSPARASSLRRRTSTGQESALAAFSDLAPIIEDLVDAALDDFTAFEYSTVDADVARFHALCTAG